MVKEKCSVQYSRRLFLIYQPTRQLPSNLSFCELDTLVAPFVGLECDSVESKRQGASHVCEQGCALGESSGKHLEKKTVSTSGGSWHSVKVMYNVLLVWHCPGGHNHQTLGSCHQGQNQKTISPCVYTSLRI